MSAAVREGDVAKGEGAAADEELCPFQMQVAMTRHQRSLTLWALARR